MCGRPSPRKGCHAVQCRGVVGGGSWGRCWGSNQTKLEINSSSPVAFPDALTAMAPRPVSVLLRGRVPPIVHVLGPDPHCAVQIGAMHLCRAGWDPWPSADHWVAGAVGGEPGEALRVNGAGDKTGDRNSSVLTSFATERIHANGPNPSTVTTNSASVATASTRCCCIVHIRPGPRLLVLDLPSHLLRHFDTPVPCPLLIASSPQAVIVANPRTTQRPTTTVKTREAGHNNPPPTTPTTRQKDALPPTPERLPDSATCSYTSTTTTSCPA